MKERRYRGWMFIPPSLHSFSLVLNRKCQNTRWVCFCRFEPFKLSSFSFSSLFSRLPRRRDTRAASSERELSWSGVQNSSLFSLEKERVRVEMEELFTGTETDEERRRDDGERHSRSSDREAAICTRKGAIIAPFHSDTWCRFVRAWVGRRLMWERWRCSVERHSVLFLRIFSGFR